jgi:hypothetical protein
MAFAMKMAPGFAHSSLSLPASRTAMVYTLDGKKMGKTDVRSVRSRKMNQIESLKNRNEDGIASHGPNVSYGCAQAKSSSHAGTANDGLLHWLGTGITPTCLPWAPERGSDDYSK